MPKGYHHKIGMGKPLGLGSVAIEPCLVMTNRSERYSKLLDPFNVRSHNAIISPPSKTNMSAIIKKPEICNSVSAGKSAGLIWLENTARDLKINLDDLMKKRPKDLPKRWTAIQESGLKKNVLNDIAALLKVNGIWDNPPTPKLEDMVEFFKLALNEEMRDDGK